MFEESLQVDNDYKELAFLLQFEGDEYEVSRKIFHLQYYRDPVMSMMQTGLFGIIDALIDLGLTNTEIIDFYIHSHVEPYDDPYEFTNGIIKIVYGMSKSEIEKQYGRYLVTNE